MNSVKVLTLQGNNVPERLRHIPDAPKTLYCKGAHLETLLLKPVVAIVGSRKVDSYGIHITKMFSAGLAERGVVIISGLALGVDVLAHKACLEMGTATIAVLPCGIETLYPRSNTNVGKQIEQNGCLISEYSGAHTPREYNFLIRNRLISGLSDGVIVTQAATRSGSLNTARHALEQGKTVMAVPGPITNPLCAGPNNLLKMGATPVTCVDDVLKALNIEDVTRDAKDYELLAQNEQELRIIKLLQAGETDGEIIARRSELTIQEFSVHLTMLEIRGLTTPLGANHWALC